MDSPRIGIGNLFLPAYQQRPKRNLTLKVGGTRFTQGSSRVFLFRAHLEIGALHKNKHKTSRFFSAFMIFRYTRFQFGSLFYLTLRLWRLLMRFFRLSTGDLNVLSVILKLLELFKSRFAKCCDMPYVTNGPDFNFLSQMKIQSWQTRKKKKGSRRQNDDWKRATKKWSKEYL